MKDIIATPTKPILLLSNKCGQLEVLWAKDNNIDSIFIEVDRSDGKGFQFLTIDKSTNYTDLAAITSKGTWKYRAIYLCKDEQVGDWSDEVTISI